jgi:DNA-binding CsgD family transcriptional regulator
MTPLATELLTPRELDAARLLTEGLSNRGIGDRMGVSENCAKKHVQHIYSKLRVESRVEIALRMKAATAENPESCHTCGQSLAPKAGELPRGQFQVNDQIWACCECSHSRKWGNDRPWDSTLKAVLNCEGCDAPTRHAFLGVVGR